MTHPIEAALRTAGALPMRYGRSGEPDTATSTRHAENLALVHAELDLAPESRLARVLRRLRVPDLAIPVVTATPALRRAWFGSVLLAVLFAVSAASNQQGTGADRVVVFLTLAPLVPLAGVALAFGRNVDPVHDLVVAAPRDTFRVFLTRAMTVLVASALLLGAVSLLLPDAGAWRLAWLLPALGLTGLTMVAGAGRDPRRVAGALAAIWVVLVIGVTQAVDAAAMFGGVTQVAAALVAFGCAAVINRRRPVIERTV